MLAFVASPAFAQAHPCDAAWPTSQTITPGAAYRVQLCATGTPTDAALLVNGTERPVQALTRVQGPNASGRSLFEGVATVSFVSGAYTLDARVFTGSVEQARAGVLAVQVGAVAPPPPPPPPPPSDPCVSNPLVISGVKWPTSNTGTRSITFGVGTKRWLKETLEWRADGKHVLTVTDDRGCTAMVRKP